MKSRTNFAATFGSGLGVVVASMVIGFITAPLGLQYWGPERYGLWALLQTLSSYLFAANLGIGQAASTLIGKQTSFTVKAKVFLRAFVILMLSTAVAAVGFFLLVVTNPSWFVALGKIPAGLSAEAQSAGTLIAAFFFVNLPLSLATSYFYGTQKAYVENLVAFVMLFVNLAVLVVVIVTGLSLVEFALLTGLAQLGANLVRTVLAYRIHRRGKTQHDEGTANEADEASYRHIIKSSFRFFLIWLASTLVWNTDNFVISNVLQVKDIAAYSITFKLFAILFSFIALVNNSFFPFVSKELGHNNWDWISRNYARASVVCYSLGGAALVGSLALGKDFILLWTGPNGFAGLPVVLVLGVYTYLLALVNLNSGMVNTLNLTKGTWVIAFGEGGIKLAGSIVLAMNFGLVGIAAGTMLGTLLSPSIFTYWVLNRRTDHRLQLPFKAMFRHLLVVVVPLAVAALVVQYSVDQAVFRVGLGVLIAVVYFVGSYLVLPTEVRRDSVELVRGLLGRIVGRRNG